MAHLTTLIAMLSGADDVASSADNLRDGYAKRDMERAVVAIVGWGGAHPIKVESVLANPRVGSAESGFAGGGVGAAISNVEQEAKGAAVAIAGGSRAHLIAVELAITKPVVGSVDGGFTGRGMSATITNLTNAINRSKKLTILFRGP